MTRVLWLSETHGHNTQPGGLDFFTVQLQLSQPFAAVNSAKVAQEGQQDRRVLPVGCQFNR